MARGVPLDASCIVLPCSGGIAKVSMMYMQYQDFFHEAFQCAHDVLTPCMALHSPIKAWRFVTCSQNTAPIMLIFARSCYGVLVTCLDFVCDELTMVASCTSRCRSFHEGGLCKLVDSSRMRPDFSGNLLLHQAAQHKQ